MSGYLASLTGLEKVYLGCALFGGGLFVFRMIMMLCGADHPDMDSGADAAAGADVDTDLHVDGGEAGHADVDHGDADHGHIDAGLKLLTFQGLTAFVMMFGLAGYAISRSSAIGSAMTILVGCLFGLFGMWLVAKGFAVMSSLQSSGTMNLYDALGEVGTVYLGIPAEGVGKVQVTVSGRLMVMDAVAQDKQALATGERVTVAEIVDGRTLAVRRA